MILHVAVSCKVQTVQQPAVGDEHINLTEVSRSMAVKDGLVELHPGRE